jgi:hypothetical protein
VKNNQRIIMLPYSFSMFYCFPIGSLVIHHKHYYFFVAVADVAAVSEVDVAAVSEVVSEVAASDVVVIVVVVVGLNIDPKEGKLVGISCAFGFDSISAK